jgi:glycolate oxidase
MLIIDAPNEDDIMALAEAVGEVCLEAGAIDVFVAENREKQQEILEIRSHIYETMKNHMLEILDITVPRAEIARFVSEVHELEEEYDTWLPTYGHAADGNVHTHLMRDRWDEGKWTEIADWKEKYAKVREKVHALGLRYRGVVSGEHGIGLVKKEFLGDFVGPRQISLMKGIKEIFDPKGILNPGKVI